MEDLIKTTIYYFTGTGNSLSIARKLAGRIPGTEVKSIASLYEAVERNRRPADKISLPANDDTRESRSRIGFVFPTYAYGLPRMVKEFVETVSLPGNAYLFAVASNCGKGAGGFMQDSPY